MTTRIGVLVFSFLLLFSEGAAAQESAPGARIWQELESRGLVDPYMAGVAQEVAGKLVQASGQWPSYQVNGRYDPAGLNIYLIDAGRMQGDEIRISDKIVLTREGLVGNPQTFEEARVILVDTRLLKEFLAATLLVLGGQHEMLQAVGEIKLRGLEGMRSLWDPARNPTLASRRPLDQWLIFYRGALAFILAHEMGHVSMGQPLSQQVSRRPLPRTLSKEDRKNLKVCPELLAPNYRDQQQVEARADDYAVQLLGKVLFPPGVTDQPRLWYELGAQWLVLYRINSELVRTLYATNSKNIRAMLRLQLGPALYDALQGQKKDQDAEADSFIAQAFPATHPASYRRLSQALGGLAKSPYSLYYGQPVDDSEATMLDAVIQRQCSEIGERLGGR